MALSETHNRAVLVSIRNPSGETPRESYPCAVRVVTERYLDKGVQVAKQAATAMLSQERAVREIWDHELALQKEGRTDKIPF